ncbi:MAG: hypothetical protein JW395_1911 [Nitrospira sp.]|nr:hypothetical protein [Nitrospira sp.]
MEVVDVGQLLGESGIFSMELEQRILDVEGEDGAGEILAERDELNDRALRGFGRSGGGFGGGHVRGGVRG